MEATGAEGFPSPADLAGADWVTLVPRSPAKGDARNTFEVSDPHRYTHVRLSIYPDGGVARLRVHGEVVPDPRFLAGTLDLAARRERRDDHRLLGHVLLLGGAPDRPRPGPHHGRRLGERPAAGRRQRLGVRAARAARPDSLRRAGHVAVRGQRARLGPAVRLWHRSRCEPGSSEGPGEEWFDLLPRTRLQPDTRHRFRLAGSPAVAAARLDVYPDGGMARLRLWGEADPAAHQAAAARWLDALPPAQAAVVLAEAGLPAARATGIATAAAWDMLPRRPRPR